MNLCFENSNSFKKTQRPVLLPKIDDKLEQYTHAIEVQFTVLHLMLCYAFYVLMIFMLICSVDSKLLFYFMPGWKIIS